MKPIAIFRFSAEDGPGYCATFLDQHSIPWDLVCVDRGETIPADASDYSGLIFMGGPMSAYDPLPWIPPLLELMRGAVAASVPCLGHCLGGQLLSKALGGDVRVNAVKEIGWNMVRVESSALADQWLNGAPREFATFQWHGDTFSIPPGATRILSGDACANQAYVIGNSLGMQCHTEMTGEVIAEWCDAWEAERADPTLPSVQTPEEIFRDTVRNLPVLHAVADRLYAKWITGLQRD